MSVFQQYQRRYGNPATPGSVQAVQSLPAPVGGWNARDSYANMDPMDAVTLTNLWPDISNVVLRGGFTQFATGLSGEVQSLQTYNGAATSQMWAYTAAGDLFNASVAGAVPAAAKTGLSSGYWEYSNITTSGGNYLVSVNGIDKLLLYDGATWAFIDGGTTPAISGVSTTSLVNVTLFKHRLWFIQKNTLKAWYLPTDSIGGTAAAFDLSAIAKKGGYLVDLDSWTIDAGYGVDDNLVFITSEGEVIVYAGTDPASASTFSLIGVWSLGAPIGPRCMLKWGGDLLILTYDGLLPLASALQSSRLDPRVALSDKIQGAISAATDSLSNAPAARGWEVFYFPRRNGVWINVPISVGTQQQYAMNTITKSWCNFTGWKANCWTLFEDEPYFGGPSYVGHAWDDSMADDGAAIPTLALQAFNYFEERGVKKYFTRARPSIFTDGTPAIAVGMNVDFDTSNTTAPLTFVPSTFGLWDSGVWDVAIWGQGLVVTNTWLGITGIGYCGGLQVQTSSIGDQIQWSSTDVVYQKGWAGI
jgi:hypothetical protein